MANVGHREWIVWRREKEGGMGKGCDEDDGREAGRAGYGESGDEKETVEKERQRGQEREAERAGKGDGESGEWETDWTDEGVWRGAYCRCLPPPPACVPACSLSP